VTAPTKLVLGVEEKKGGLCREGWVGGWLEERDGRGMGNED